jgi:hypothetical protein
MLNFESFFIKEFQVDIKIRNVPSHTIPTEKVSEGKELVSIETLIAAFGISDEFTAIGIKSLFNSGDISFAEKRNETSLLLGLQKHCLGRQEAHQSPIVTKDEWVYWVRSSSAGSTCRPLH